jgi:S1-C subfamily serine protease
VVVVDAYREGNDEPVHRSSAGVLVTRNGYVFAPLFVVRDADFVIVSFDQETRCPARVLATDRNTQLAVLKAGAPPAGVTVPELSPAAAERLEAVVALVAPKAAGGRALPGKIMVTDRNAGPFQGVLEVELQGEPGPLGGILLDQEGRLAGMAVGTVAPEGETGGAGAGRTRLLVIPSSQMRQSLDRILTGMPGTDLEGERELLTS